MTEVTVFGAGAVGSLTAARLLEAGLPVTLVARGERLAALRAHGLTLEKPDGSVVRTDPTLLDAQATAGAGPSRTLIVTLKAPGWAAALDGLKPLIGPDTVIVPILNGVPWWYTYRGAADPGHPLETIDPGGAIRRAIPLDRVVGAVTYVAAATPAPGRIKHTIGDEMVVGEPDGQFTRRLVDVADLLAKARFKVETTSDIRGAIWTKLWGNAVFNPLSVATGSTMTEMGAMPELHRQLLVLMQEARTIGEAVGIAFQMTVEDRLRLALQLGDFKTSMLQDWEKGVALELEAILGAVLEMGQAAGVETPHLALLYAIVKRKAATAGLL